ncbi:hypothetical protein RchiOBHm_Chr7g0214691 [Rosa chinensis]|uniref:Uncharacterized protein n=1 Tax=Rosa chinensis TaxID=74649 RepID=A0A2P6PBB0_ROSCH|nr:hypothetical protein RchiOBHm_Chr7g0214691 [Rosa chinensis]
MFCEVDVLAGVFFAWLTLQLGCKAICCAVVERETGGFWLGSLLTFMTFHQLVIHSWIHMYHIRDCDRSGISIAPWR